MIRVVTLGIVFGAPTLIGGLALAGIPILIHLLHRQRHKVMNWAAMKWLIAAMKKNQRWIQVEQWILLAIRTAIIALVVLAMMKPAFEQSQGFFAVLGPSRHHIIVIDNSLSMQYGEGNFSRFERAKEMANAILDDARQGDTASVVVLASPPMVLVGEASPYLMSVAEEIEALEPQDGLARIDQAIEPISQICRSSPTSRRQVYIITDMQRSTWLGERDNIDVTELRRRLVELGEQADFTILDTSGAESPNLAVTSIEQVDPIAIVGRPVVVRAAVTNFGRADVPGVKVELRVGGQIEAAQDVSLAPGESKFVNFTPTLRDTRDQKIEVRIVGDPLPADNSRWLVVRVREQLKVLIIDGDPSGEPFRSESDYLRVALAPEREDGTEGFVHVDVKMESDLLEETLDRWDIVILANVGQLTEAEEHVIAEYVHRGGGVTFFLGGQTNIESFNRVLYADGKGVLPVELVEFAGQTNPPWEGHTFDPKGYNNPLIEDFRDNEQAGLLTTRTYKYVKVKLPEGSSAKPLLLYDNGDPAVVLAHEGLGYVAVITSGADLDWNSWPISPSYLPIMQQLAQMLAAGRVRRIDIHVGETIELALPDGAGEVDARMTPPPVRSDSGEPVRPIKDVLRPHREGGLTMISYPETGRAGVYDCQLGSPIDAVWSTAVNTWPAESDLVKLGEDELKGALAGWNFRLLDRLESDEPLPAVSASDRGSIHRQILYLVLALVLLEPAVSWWFSRLR